MFKPYFKQINMATITAENDHWRSGGINLSPLIAIVMLSIIACYNLTILYH